MFQLKIIIASTREGRKGPAIAAWIVEEAKKRSEFETVLLDLKIINLPFLDEPEHPRLRKYIKQTTKDWSAIIESSDAFIVVMPEYNHGYTAPLKNALDTVYQEWNNKPMAFVSYGQLAGGTRAVQLIKPVITALKIIPMLESVNISFFTKYIDENGKFNPDETIQNSPGKMLDELLKWTEALKGIREK